MISTYSQLWSTGFLSFTQSNLGVIPSFSGKIQMTAIVKDRLELCDLHERSEFPELPSDRCDARSRKPRGKGTPGVPNWIHQAKGVLLKGLMWQIQASSLKILVEVLSIQLPILESWGNGSCGWHRFTL